MADDFLKQLGISKTEADKKITNSILSGYLNAHGVTNIKNITTGNRAGIVTSLLVYTKKQTASPAFIAEYNAIKNSNKPSLHVIITPAENRKQTIVSAEEAVASMEKVLKTATPDTKKIFEDALAEQVKQLKEVKDPKNKQLAEYEKNYQGLMKKFQESHER